MGKNITGFTKLALLFISTEEHAIILISSSVVEVDFARTTICVPKLSFGTALFLRSKVETLIALFTLKSRGNVFIFSTVVNRTLGAVYSFITW